MGKISVKTSEKVQKLNKETLKAIKDAENGKGLSKGYTDLNEMWKDLDSDKK